MATSSRLIVVDLMLSPGSAGLVRPLTVGIVVLYTMATPAGDFVRIGEHEDVENEPELPAVKSVTYRLESITIPNSLLISSMLINCFRLAQPEGVIVAAGVAIGYDVPWRQVHAMLIIAANRGSRIRE